MQASVCYRLQVCSLRDIKPFQDLREWLEVLDKEGLLFRISRPVVKETELTPLARLQYRGLPEEERRAFLFENVVDAKGRKYEAQVATGVYASSLRMYALGLMCEPTRDAIQEKWTKAQLKPIEPKIVSSGPVQECVYEGEELLKDGKGIEYLPIPVELQSSRMGWMNLRWPEDLGVNQ